MLEAKKLPKLPDHFLWSGLIYWPMDFHRSFNDENKVNKYIKCAYSIIYLIYKLRTQKKEL